MKPDERPKTRKCFQPKEITMDIFTAIEERRSCREFSPEAVAPAKVERILEAGSRAPSPLNTQPWKFIVITARERKDDILAEVERCKAWAIEETGWKWIESYGLDFLKQAPVIIAVVGDPQKTGIDQFQTEGNVGYQLACAAAIQNMLLAAHALDLGSLWFTFFDRGELRKILDIPTEKTPISLVCIGKPAQPPAAVGRKPVAKLTTYIE
jgi:5,6-dimethylbenzimidazole synthase